MVRLAIVFLTLAACGDALEEPGPDAGAPDGGDDRPDATETPRPDAAPSPDGPRPEAMGPTRYPADLVRSPITSAIAERARTIAARGPTQKDDVFMKVGASGTVSPWLLHCFAGPAVPHYQLDLDGRDELEPTIDHFRDGRIGQTTPFNRGSVAAVVGKTAKWAITGTPSPLAQEMTAARPRFAIIDYGANDMGGGATYGAALAVFWENLHDLLDQVEAAGIVPIVTGLWPRADSASAALWVPTYDAATRALAEARQIPYLSLYNATVTLPGKGLVADGLHGNTYLVGGAAQPCLFTPPAMAYHYNVRNLATLETLDAVRRVVLEEEPAPDEPHLDPVAGIGSEAQPFVIDELGFTHAGDTRAGTRNRDGYPGCDSGQNESGPELVYRLSLPSATPVRIVVLDRGAVDVDVHVLTGGTCVARDDKIIQRRLPAGDHLIVVDTFVSGGVPRSGPFGLVVVRCEAGDPSCG